MAVPSYVGAGTGVVIETGTGTVSKTGCTSGNVLLVHLLERGTTGDYGRGNYSNINNLLGAAGINPIALGRDIGVGGTSKHALFAGRASASATCSLDFTVGASGNDLFVRMYEFSGAFAGNADDGVGLLENNGATLESDANTSTTVNDRACITTGADRLALQFVGIDANVAIAAFTGMSGGTWAEATAEYAEATGATATLQLQTAEMASAGTIDGGSTTISSAGYGVLSTALIPDTTSGGPSPRTLVASSGARW